MQHIHAPTLTLDGHNTVWRAVKYLSAALAGLVVVFEHSPGLLIVLAIAVVMGLALAERTRKLSSGPHLNLPASVSRLLGDGGSFPDADPEAEQQEAGAPRVLDGGSV
jgi:hypothetical protein